MIYKAVEDVTLKFYGSGDDTFTCLFLDEDKKYMSMHPIANDYDTFGNGRTILMRLYDEVENEGVIVTGKYMGTWSIGITPHDDDYPTPHSPMRWELEGYTAILSMEIPKGVTVQVGVLEDVYDLNGPKWMD